MKKHTRMITSLLLTFIMLFTLTSQSSAQATTLLNTPFKTSAMYGDIILNEDSSYVISNQSIDSVSAESSVDYWYENLPIYSGNVTEKSIDVAALTNLNTDTNAVNISKSVASIQVERLAVGNDNHFEYWQNADITTPVNIYNLDDSLFGFAYGVVDSSNKIVGYLVTSASKDAPPVLEYSYDPTRFILMQESSKVYFNSNTGIVLKNDNELKSITGDSSFTQEECEEILDLSRTATHDTASISAIEQEWTQFGTYAKIAMATTQKEATDNTFVSQSAVATPISSTTATQTRLQLDTADHTWLTICSYTTMAMYFDAFGRRVDPGLLGTKRPHSIQLNKTLHSRYGCNPSFQEIADNCLDWANAQKLSPYLTFTNYLVTDDNECWNKHSAQIDKNLPTMVGYVHSSGSAHIMMGIGYTSDDYYIVRDTWTNDGNPMNSTFYYNSYGYSFLVLGLDYTNSDTSTAWGNVVLKKGDSNFNVRRLKIMLSLFYYDPGDLTSNTFDEQTEEAVKLLQEHWGLTTDGMVGPATYARLKTMHVMLYDANTGYWRYLNRGLTGDDVAQLQIRLYRMGYLDDTCDGVFGSNTEAALMEYQAAKGLTADGVAGPATFAKLYGSYNTYIREYLPCEVCSN